MTAFHAWIDEALPRLHLWRQMAAGRGAEFEFDRLPNGIDGDGLQLFEVELDHQIHEPIGFTLFFGEREHARWEDASHNRRLPRLAQYRFPADVWFVHGVRRVLLQNPFAAAFGGVRIHVITARKYRDGRLYAWLPGEAGRFVDAAGSEPDGIYFDVPLSGSQRHLCAFKFVTRDGTFEVDASNRLWSAHDGGEVWTHADTDAVVTQVPERRTLTVHLLHGDGLGGAPSMHVWGAASDFVSDVPGTAAAAGELRFTQPGLYTGREYRFGFVQPATSDAAAVWEHSEAERRVVPQPSQDVECWTLEGDHELYGQPPVRDRDIAIEVVEGPPSSLLGAPLVLDVWANRARGFLQRGVAADVHGRYAFTTYPEIVTSFRFRSPDAHEALERHTYKVPADASGTTELFAVLERHDPLPQRPPTPLFRDPPSGDWIARPGAWRHGDAIRFAVHAPTAARVQVIGEWTDWRARPVPMQSTNDGAYWWGEVPVADIRGGDVHGALYKYLISDVREQQDPAADWVESSSPQHASKLVDHARHLWQSTAWQTPGKDYLIVYQLHPKRFTGRFATAGATALDQVAEEVRNPRGYVRALGITAILLMPVNEFSGDDSWGYNPAFFYAVESAYGGPDALKRFVDTCHAHGIAVLLDVVFNHAGASDNALWAIARDSFFKGDTKWGALINFAHPQVGHFFEQNLRYLVRHYHVDGFRLDSHVDHSLQRQGRRLRDPAGERRRMGVHAQAATGRARRERSRRPAGGAPAERVGPDQLRRTDGQPVVRRLPRPARGRLSRPARDARAGRCPVADPHRVRRLVQGDELSREPRRGRQRGRPHRPGRPAGHGIAVQQGGGCRHAVLARHPDVVHGRRGRRASSVPVHSHRRARPGSVRVGGARASCAGVVAGAHRPAPRERSRAGPAPLTVACAEGQLLVFSRGGSSDYVVIANFGGWSGWKPLRDLRVPDGRYVERLNSTWAPYRVEHEDEHPNGTGVLGAGDWIHLPDYGVIVLERT